MIATNPNIYHIWWGYRGGVDPSQYNKVRLNLEATSWTQPITFEVIQAWIYGDNLSDADSQIVINWNQTPSYYIGPNNSYQTQIVPLKDTIPKTSNELLTIPRSKNLWINSQFAYRQYLSEGLSCIDFWLSRIGGASFDVSSTTLPDWQCHLIFQLS